MSHFFAVLIIAILFPDTADTCLFKWTASFSLPREQLLKRNTLLTTLPTLTKEWRVSFELNPSSYVYNGFAQILHLTTGGKYGKFGDRTPALWIHKSKGVYISTYLNGKPHAVGKYFPTKKPTINEWTKVEMSQAKIGPKYMFSLTIKGETVWHVENTDPRQFSDVLVYTSSPWYVAQAGSIRDFRIENMKPG